MFFQDITLAVLTARLIALLVGTTFHEFMHNYVGWLMGDPTPEQQGRLTLNPIPHINPVGFLMFLIVGFGFLGAAPINMMMMTYPRVRWGERLTRVQRFGMAVLAGPVGNLIVAVAFAVPFRLLQGSGLLVPDTSQIVPGLAHVLVAVVWWNVLLFLFNLIPLGPLDGRYILRMFLPDHLHYQYEDFQNRYGMLILFGLIFLSFLSPINVFGQLIITPTLALTGLLMGQNAFTLFAYGMP